MLKKHSKAPSSKCGKAATSSATKSPASSSHGRKSKKGPPTLTSEDELSSESEEEPSAKQTRKSGRVTWSDLSHTDRLLDWLDQNAEDQQKLFSDSSQDAHKEQRRRCVAPGSKAVYHLQIATAVFSVDAKSDIHEEFKVDPDKYAKAVENCLGVSVLSVTPLYIHHSLI